MIVSDRILDRTVSLETELYSVDMSRGVQVEVAAVVKNLGHHSSCHHPEAGTDQACTRVRAMVLSRELDNQRKHEMLVSQTAGHTQMKVHEMEVWGPRTADHMAAAKVRDLSEEVIAGTLTHHDKKKAKLQAIGEAEERRHGTFAEV